MKKRLLVLLICSFISACGKNYKNIILDKPVPVNSIDRRGEALAKTDRSIEEEIADELNSLESLANHAHLQIATYNGAVLIVGEVTNEKLKNKVLETVRIIPHVKMVHDHILVGVLSNGESRSQDKQILNNVKKALNQIDINGFDGSLVRVLVEENKVYLMGQLHREEGITVINVTRLEPYVKQVVTAFEYLD